MGERIVLEDFNHFGGYHCQTTALKSILNYKGLDISEEMLLALAGGIGFIYWYMKMMPAPFVGGRGGGKEFELNMLRRLGGDASFFQSTSVNKAHEELKNTLRNGEPVYTYGDMAYLPYLALPEEAHFGGHTFAVYGIDEDEDRVYIADRGIGPVYVSIEDLKRARGSKYPPFQPKHKILKIEAPDEIGDLVCGIREGIKNSCDGMLKPPIKNFGLAGIKKWAAMLLKWPKQFKGMNMLGCLFNIFIYIDLGGTGGASFRPMYVRFLREAAPVIDEPELEGVAELFLESAEVWREIAKAALPDSHPELGRIRELSYEKNEKFEKQPEGWFERSVEINKETSVLMKTVAEGFEKQPPIDILKGLKPLVLKLHDMEEKAFTVMDQIINK